MPRSTRKLYNLETLGALSWAKVIAGIAGSAVATGVIRRLPLGRTVLTAAPLIVAAMQRHRDRPKDGRNS
jgi:uncharacterized membrane protein YeaQ/YmgE (transglycosylase-associated protein family)